MDGKLLLYHLRQTLEEMSDSSFLDDFTSYNFLYEAAIDLQRRTKMGRKEQSITTVADQANYALNADYLGLYLQNDSRNYFIKLNDGSYNYFPTWYSYEDIIYRDQSSDSVTIPNNFTIRNKESLYSQVTGTATSNGASMAGECTLTDTSGAFTTDGTSVGDIVHNTTDGSMGIVLSITSATAIKTALFGGTANDWTSADAYVIQPQSRYEIYFDPPPSTAGYTATVYYLKRPDPVYSDYGMYRFPSHFMFALVKYAAWLYKYRDKTPDFGDKWYQFYDMQTRMLNTETDHILKRNRFKVNFKYNGRR